MSTRSRCSFLALCILVVICSGCLSHGDGIAEEKIGTISIEGAVRTESKGEWFYWFHTDIGKFPLNIEALPGKYLKKELRLDADIMKRVHVFVHSKREYEEKLRTHQMQNLFTDVPDGATVTNSVVLLSNVVLNGRSFDAREEHDSSLRLPDDKDYSNSPDPFSAWEEVDAQRKKANRNESGERLEKSLSQPKS